MEDVFFNKEKTLGMKGMAIIIMLFHHCFLSGRYTEYEMIFYPLQESFVNQLATFSKICVSIFAFLSGYGLYLNYQETKLSDSKWVCTRYIKTFSNYWFVMILFSIISQIIDNRFISTYFQKGIVNGIAFFLTDFLGLANLFGTSSLIGTWWYMSAALVFILLTPVIAKQEGEKLPLYLVGGWFFYA